MVYWDSDIPRECSTLSFLQGIHSLLKGRFYHFIHITIQEILASYHIAAQIPEISPVSLFQSFFNQPRFAAVFQFYAVHTKLKVPGIRDIIDQILERGSKHLLISLLSCLYEAQDSSLCSYVGEKLDHMLILDSILLSPLDCLCNGYFLSSVIFQVQNWLLACAIGSAICAISKTVLLAEIASPKLYNIMLFVLTSTLYHHCFIFL